LELGGKFVPVIVTGSCANMLIVHVGFDSESEQVTVVGFILNDCCLKFIVSSSNNAIIPIETRTNGKFFIQYLIVDIKTHTNIGDTLQCRIQTLKVLPKT
jgi:hypothetical protein